MEIQQNGALDLSVKFEELAPHIGLSSSNKIQYIRDSQIGDLSLGLASIQDPRGPLRKKDDDLVADTIMEKASGNIYKKNYTIFLVQAKNLVKSNKSKICSREITFLAVLNFAQYKN